MNELTIYDIKVLKSKLEKDIQSLIFDFREKTDCSITKISLYNRDRGFGEPPNPAYNVRLKLVSMDFNKPTQQDIINAIKAQLELYGFFTV